jgi:hypothetical protein
VRTEQPALFTRWCQVVEIDTLFIVRKELRLFAQERKTKHV